jgi:hypothetical protein
MSELISRGGIFSTILLDKHECEVLNCKLNNEREWTAAKIINYGDPLKVDDNGYIVGTVNIKVRDALVANQNVFPAEVGYILHKLEECIVPEIQKRWGIGGLSFNGTQFVKYIEGAHIKLHNDGGSYLNHRVLSLVLYLNDEYMGGEIHFPQLGIIHKPQKGELIVFVADLVHEVLPVLNGTRYSFVTFLCKDG